MTSKEELLKRLTVNQLKQLAKDNNIKLINRWMFGNPPIHKKDDIVRLLRDSPKITTRKINKIMKEKKNTSSIKNDKRRSLTAAERDKILIRQKYLCAMCKSDISKIPYNIDHKIPLALGGSVSLRNIQFLCPTCHAIKTREDRDKISKRRRK